MVREILRWVHFSAQLTLSARLRQYKRYVRQKRLALQLLSAQADLLPESLKFDSDWMAKLPYWRKSGDGQPRCYSYALNQGEIGHSAPGHFGARLRKLEAITKPWTAEKMEIGLINDGLKSLEMHPDGPIQGWLISAFISRDGSDFHFKQLNAQGIVSDKPGVGNVRRLTAPEDTDQRVAKELLTYRHPLTNESYLLTGMFVVDSAAF